MDGWMDGRTDGWMDLKKALWCIPPRPSPGSFGACRQRLAVSELNCSAMAELEFPWDVSCCLRSTPASKTWVRPFNYACLEEKTRATHPNTKVRAVLVSQALQMCNAVPGRGTGPETRNAEP